MPSHKRPRLSPPASTSASASAPAASSTASAAAEGRETTSVSSIEAEIGRIDNELDDLDAQAQDIACGQRSLRGQREKVCVVCSC